MYISEKKDCFQQKQRELIDFSIGEGAYFNMIFSMFNNFE